MQNISRSTRSARVGLYTHRITALPPQSAAIIIQKRLFAEGDHIHHPKVYKNIFNKRVSRDGKRVVYTSFPFDYNEPWPFPPVYDEIGEDLNKDPVWGRYGVCPPSSVTGKPKRQLGHYPWLGRPIVPLDESFRHIADDQVAPYPFFRAGRYENNRAFYWQWGIFFAALATFIWFVDVYWRDTKTFAKKRDELWYREHMATSYITWAPLGMTLFGNPTAPIELAFAEKDKWAIQNEMMGDFRFDMVFIPAAKEDMFPDSEFHVVTAEDMEKMRDGPYKTQTLFKY